MNHPNLMPFPPPPPPVAPGIPQAHVHMIYLPHPPPVGVNANWLPPPPPPPTVRHGRHRLWKGERDDGYPRPNGEDLFAYEIMCNAPLKSKQRRHCRQSAVHQPSGGLPVCKRHKSIHVPAGRCKYIDEKGRCDLLIKAHHPYAELCNDHRDWNGLPSYLLKLPVELRMQIFSYLLPDKPINAWLDAPVRQDRQRIAWELLLVNRQISAEALDILYGSQPFTLSLGRDNIALCGGIYGHDKSEWPSIMVYNPPRTRLERNGHAPPMLHKIKHLRLQINFVNPGFPSGRPQHYPTWEESIDLYDLRDSAQALVHLLQQRTSLQSLSIILIAQNTNQRWTDEQLLKILQTIILPFEQLRSIPKIELLVPLQIHKSFRLSYTQYFPDSIRPAIAGDEVAQPGEFVLDYKYSGHKFKTPMKVTASLADYNEFTAFKQNFEGLISSIHPQKEQPQAALEAFASFRKAYHTVESHFRTVLPRGKDWLLHCGRVARENNDIAGIAKVRHDLEVTVKRLIASERDAIAEKERAAMKALECFDEERISKKRKRSVDDDGANDVEDEDQPLD